MPEVVITA